MQDCGFKVHPQISPSTGRVSPTQDIRVFRRQQFAALIIQEVLRRVKDGLLRNISAD
jgi:hypothetical protein